jgi:hypothetical protein
MVFVVLKVRETWVLMNEGGAKKKDSNTQAPAMRVSNKAPAELSPTDAT